MASRIVHFGIDQRAALPILQQNGYDLEDCGISLPRLDDALNAADVDAVVISQSTSQPAVEAASITRSHSSALLILFENTKSTSNRESFDLVIPLRVPSSRWLKQVAQLIEKTYALRQTQSVPERSDSSLHQSAATRENTQFLRAEDATIFRSTPTPHRAGSANHRDRQVVSSASVSVLVVDDHERWRETVHRLLNHRPNVKIVGHAADAVRATELAAELQPQLILLDIGMPGMSGIEAARHIFRVAPQTKIIFVTQDNNADVVEHALGTGAHGYVLKTDTGRELPNAIEAVLQNQRFVSSGVTKILRYETAAHQ
jgi:CheY-like chemotaxis protein